MAMTAEVKDELSRLVVSAVSARRAARALGAETKSASGVAPLGHFGGSASAPRQ